MSLPRSKTPFASILLVSIVLALAVPMRGVCADSTTQKHLQVSRVMHIQYGSTAWNRDSTKIDTAFLILRDRTSGKIVLIQLEETEPDSSEFSGRFSINVGQGESISPEVFIPPANMRGSENNYKQLHEMINQGKLTSKPLIWKKNAKGQAVLDVYDTRDQAEMALKSYQAEQKLAQEIRQKKPLKSPTNEEAMAAAQAAERKAQLDKLALEAARRAEERLRLEQIERQKAAERARLEKQRTEEERVQRKAEAARVNAEALSLYNRGEFAEAEAKFKQAVELDPDNKDYQYKFGITLYRNQKYNEALVALKICTVSPAEELEKKYYMGLVYYRLSELDNALKQFSEVGASKDPVMGPSATFYSGVILFAEEKYEPAKKSFETVIDMSKDPHLDDQADEYIDRIAAAMAFQKLRENKWTLTGTIGVMYDSNVLLNPSNNQGEGQPTNSPDFRLLTLADLQYRPIFNEHNEWTPHASFNLTNSEKDSNAKADPYLYTVAAPYSYKGTVGGKGYKLTLNPGTDVLYMDPTDTGTKHLELMALYLGIDNTFVMSKDWISLYSLEYRNETSYDPTSIGVDDMSGSKYTVRTIQTFFVDKARKQALMPMLGYMIDSTAGSAREFTRYDLGVTFVRPIFWGSTWSSSLAYYNLKYPNYVTPSSRTDNDFSISTGLSKPIRDWVIWGLNGSYTDNQSNDVTSAYNKFVILTTATFITNF